MLPTIREGSGLEQQQWQDWKKKPQTQDIHLLGQDPLSFEAM